MKSLKKGTRFYKTAVLGIILLLGFNLSIQAAATSSANTKAVSTSLKEAEQEKKALEKELAEAKEAIADLKQSKGNAEEKLAALNERLMNISERITTLEKQLEDKNNDILDTKEQLEEARKIEAQQYEDMKIRIQFMYENSHTTYLQLLLEAKDISSLLNSVEYISEIQRYDREKLEEYKETVEYVAGVEKQLEQDYEDLQEMKASVEEEKASVAALMKQKETELANIANDIDTAQSEADYYAAEIQAQEELIAEIKRIEAEKAAAGKNNHPYTGGVFTWPCPSSTRVTSDYGTRTSPTSGASTNHKGIDIGAEAGADIVAAASGTVTSAAYSSAAGNYVMIDHGGGVYTVYMHASALLVSPGQEVSAGQVIAKVGSTGISTGNHLHFGVSVNGSYVSPWSYLGG
ncbi:MAG: peptidoglycan DD-metalloendopeptidase family protein [Clostridiales bacterium]|nr:peptidoglycan DD-metalloendopeptidase family protein [Clostridiales bacterium]